MLSSITLIGACDNLLAVMRSLKKRFTFEVHSLLQYDWCLEQFSMNSWDFCGKNLNSGLLFDVLSPICLYEQLDFFYWLIFDSLKRLIQVEEIPIESPKFEATFRQFYSTEMVFFSTEEGPKPYAKLFQRAINKQKVEVYCVAGIEVEPQCFHVRLTVYILDRI
ncbi:unnamed protein product, partial [Mesorhabditis belari]|uniref:Uncharacterized protein n=1 Tax=Mesorhabditis belari TaxID=2138241 RepID=A0AAF3FSI9_9BILA